MKKLFFLICFSVVYSSGFQGDDKAPIRKVNGTDHYNYIAVNNIKMWLGNNGSGSHDPVTDFGGLYWPGGENAVKTLSFAEGLLMGGLINGEVRIGGYLYRSGLQGGKIIDGKPDDPKADKYRVYKIKREWEKLPSGPERETLRRDYAEWPVKDGAPYKDINGDGQPTLGIDKPKLIGDETLWFVANDMNDSVSAHFFGSRPMGLEVQVTIWGYNRYNILQDVVFKKYKIINKGYEYIRDMYFCYFADADIGRFSDDFAGCDTSLQLGYVWNGLSKDIIYQSPPALGYTLLQGPAVPAGPVDSAFSGGSWQKGLKNLPMTAFLMQNIPWSYPPFDDFGRQDREHFYNIFQGKAWDGSPFYDPHTGVVVNKILAGDPVNGTGWYEGEGWPDGLRPGDRRIFLSSGPFNLSPGDTQEVTYAIHVGKWTNNVSSISHLREQSIRLKQVYFSELTSVEESPGIKPVIPGSYKLDQNYPNPFNPGTVIGYQIPFASHVTLKIFDILGNEIQTLVDEVKVPGIYEVSWNAENLPGGVYIYQLESGGYLRAKKMVLLK